MPLVLSHTIDPASLQPEDFRVVTRSGAEHTPHCVTLRPASDAHELRTVLLIGELGDAEEDPPEQALVVSELLSDGDAGAVVDFQDTRVEVTPLEAGPFLVLGQVVPNGRWSVAPPTNDTEPEYRRGSVCPTGTEQVVRVTWAGGVRLPGGAELGQEQRDLYTVTVAGADDTEADIVPIAIGDLGDRDNNHLLCLPTTEAAVRVSFPAKQVVDPNQDLNPATEVIVSRAHD